MKVVSRAAVEHTEEDRKVLHQQYNKGAKHDQEMVERLAEYESRIDALNLHEEIENANQNRKKEAISASVRAAQYNREYEDVAEEYTEEDVYLTRDFDQVSDESNEEFDEYL